MTAKPQSKSKNLYALYFVILGAFIAVGIFTGIHHEPWADEAQSWLIARDTGLLSMFKAASYEGTQPLWYFVIKFFQLFHLPYDYLFVIPLTVTAVGAVLLLFFTEISAVTKTLILTSFITIYQSGVVARNYSLVFPCCMLIAITYKNRIEKPLPYFAGLFLVAMTSSYGTIIAGSFMLANFTEILYAILKKVKEQRKYVISFFVCGLLIFAFTLLVLPPSDVGFSPGNSGKSIFRIITNIFLLYFDSEIINVIAFVILVVFFIWYCSLTKNTIKALLLATPLLLYLFLFAGNSWHYTNYYFLILTVMIIFKPDFKELGKGKSCLIKTVIIIVLCIQTALSINVVKLDYQGDYSGSEKAALFISEYVEKGDDIYASDYFSTALQPYFDENIYVNHPGKSGYYFWSTNNGYNISYDLKVITKTVGKEPDVIVTGLSEEVSFDGYKKNVFNGNLYYKNTAAKDSTITVWVKE